MATLPTALIPVPLAVFVDKAQGVLSEAHRHRVLFLVPSHPFPSLQADLLVLSCLDLLQVLVVDLPSFS